MVTKTTFKKKFPDVKVQKLQTSVVFSRQQVEETVLKMCNSLGTGLLYYNYSNRRYRRRRRRGGNLFEQRQDAGV